MFETIKTLPEGRHQLKQISAYGYLTFALGLPLSAQRTGGARSQQTTPVSIDTQLVISPTFLISTIEPALQ